MESKVEGFLDNQLTMVCIGNRFNYFRSTFSDEGGPSWKKTLTLVTGEQGTLYTHIIRTLDKKDVEHVGLIEKSFGVVLTFSTHSELNAIEDLKQALDTINPNITIFLVNMGVRTRDFEDKKLDAFIKQCNAQLFDCSVTADSKAYSDFSNSVLSLASQNPQFLNLMTAKHISEAHSIVSKPTKSTIGRLKQATMAFFKKSKDTKHPSFALNSHDDQACVVQLWDYLKNLPATINRKSPAYLLIAELTEKEASSDQEAYDMVHRFKKTLEDYPHYQRAIKFRSFMLFNRQNYDYSKAQAPYLIPEITRIILNYYDGIEKIEKDNQQNKI